MFKEFLEAYYEYLEQTANTLPEGRALERSANILNYIDIDHTLPEFANTIYSQFLTLFPDDIVADKTKILKKINNFYRARGTEKSYKFLLRLLSGQEATLYYPKRDVFRASDGKWFVQKALRVSDITANGVANNTLAALQLFEDKLITGNTSNATASVESVEKYFQIGAEVNELSLSNINRTFESGETIRALYTDDSGVSRLITANIQSGIVSGIAITDPGTGYDVGDLVVLTGGGGTGAMASVSRVTTGNISSIGIENGGAGFRANDFILFSGGGGTGANAYVILVDEDGNTHPNSYNVCVNTLAEVASANLMAAQTIFAISTSNLALNTIQSVISTFTYQNTGPATAIFVAEPGDHYTDIPSLDIISNTQIRALGILGRLNINSGGLDYAVGDQLIFTNVPGGYGVGAAANVTNVAANGMIDRVKFQPVSGHIIGGSGYTMDALPLVSVNTAAGSGANITVTAILGDGESLTTNTGTIGLIEQITIDAGGQGYTSAPTIDLTDSGDGTAQAVATVVQGVFSYPGRFLNDDGFASSFNFIQDGDYYQNYSYVIRVRENLNAYVTAVKTLLHPAGMKMFGEYLLEDDTLSTDEIANNENIIISTETVYEANVITLDGSTTHLRKLANLTGSTPAREGTISLWFRQYQLQSNGGNTVLVFGGRSNTQLNFGVFVSNTGSANSGTGNFIRILAANNANAEILNMTTNADSLPLINSEWYHVLASWNLAASDITTNTHIYINNVASKTLVANLNSTIPLANMVSYGIGGMPATANLLLGNIAEVWFTNTYIDLANTTNRNKFAVNFQPVYLGPTGNTPTDTPAHIYLRSNAANWATNEGTGGDFTIVGTPTDDETSPNEVV